MDKGILTLTAASLLGATAFAATPAENAQHLPTVTTTDFKRGNLFQC